MTSLRGFLPHVNICRPVFLCCDIQSAFRLAVPNFGQSAFVAKRFLQYHEIQGKEQGPTMYLATEQVPNKLGELDPFIGVPKELKYSKTLFSMITAEVEEKIVGRDTFVLFGIESHVCILQTVEALLARQKRVFIAADGTWSQRDSDREPALQLMRESGAIISSSESILLQLTRDAADPKFKQISNLLKQQPSSYAEYYAAQQQK